MASTSLIFILWNASSTQAMMIIAMVTMPVTVVTANPRKNARPPGLEGQKAGTHYAPGRDAHYRPGSPDPD